MRVAKITLALTLLLCAAGLSISTLSVESETGEREVGIEGHSNATASSQQDEVSIPTLTSYRTLQGHSGWVTAVAFSSDGQRLASGSWDHSVKIWDVATGRAVRTIEDGTKGIQALALSSDGRWLAAESADNDVTLWNVANERDIRTLSDTAASRSPQNNWVYTIAFSPDGRWLASAIDNKTVRLWDVNTGRVVHDFVSSPRPVTYVAFSPDGRWLASGRMPTPSIFGRPVRVAWCERLLVTRETFAPWPSVPADTHLPQPATTTRLTFGTSTRAKSRPSQAIAGV